MEMSNVGGHIGFSFVEFPVRFILHTLDLEQGEEALHHGVIPAIVRAVH
jgi:hypothetical protein